LSQPDHVFWPDTVSLLEASHFDVDAFTHHGQITGSCLLALAVKNNGRLVTLDTGIKTGTVEGSERVHLQTIRRGDNEPGAQMGSVHFVP
jgi:uncharacterized protein